MHGFRIYFVFLILGVFFLVGRNIATLMAPSSQPPTVCRAEAYPACPAAPACPAPPACPPQPTLEIRKPLSEELDSAAAACKPEVEHTLAALEDTTTSAHEALNAALRSGVSSSGFGWLDDEAARKAAADAIMSKEAAYAALDAAYDAQMKCRRAMEALFHATDAWSWIDGEEMDEAMGKARGFADAFHEAVGYEFDGVSCNVVARRLECPLPRPAAP
jgi:hypothetical protein